MTILSLVTYCLGAWALGYVLGYKVAMLTKAINAS